jgi:GTPase
VRIAMVGYTNVGKSTIMNLLTRADILAENKLFATLDTTVRKLVLPDEEGLMTECLLSDTVGFIRKLPHELIESFKSTLAEVVEADFLIHVVDAGSPHFEEQMQIVKDTLREIGAGDKPVLLVFNKIDAFQSREDDFGNPTMSLEEFERSWIARENHPAVFISAMRKENIGKLQACIVRLSKQILQEQKRN